MKKIIAIALMFVSASVLARPEYTCEVTTYSHKTIVDTANGNKVYSNQKGMDMYSNEIEDGITYSLIVNPANPKDSNLVVFKRKMPSFMASAICTPKGN